MNKKILSIIGLFSLLSLAGCGENNSSNSLSIYTNGEVEYKVNVLLPNGQPLNNSNTQVQWCSGDRCFMPVSLDELGKASTYLIPGDYEVHLLNLPDDYAYNPNINIMSADVREININLYTIKLPSSGNGSMYSSPIYNDEGDVIGYTDGRYIVNEGVYEVTYYEDDNVVFYGFEPKKPGVYSIESWGTNIDTLLGYYGASSMYVTSEPAFTIDEGGVGGNFKYEFEISEGMLIRNSSGEVIDGASLTFGISVKGENVVYPCEFPLSITWEREYIEKTIEVTNMEPTETLVKYAKPEGKTLYKASMDGTLTYFYNENDGYYHARSVNGPIIMAKLTQTIKEFFYEPLNTFESAGNKVFTVEDGTKNYSDFVNAYAAICNEDGVCPVTQELKIFIEEFAKQQSYFIEGGWINNQVDYVIDSENQWLFPCYYYDVEADFPVYGKGTEDNPFIIESGKYNAELTSGKEISYTFPVRDETSYVIKSETSKAKITIDNPDDVNIIEGTTSGENGFRLVFNLIKKENSFMTLNFKISSDDESVDSVIFILSKESKEIVGMEAKEGTNKFDIKAESTQMFTLLVTEQRTFRIYLQDKNLGIRFTRNDEDYNYVYSDGSFEITLQAGERFIFEAYTLNNLADSVNFYIVKL